MRSNILADIALERRTSGEKTRVWYVFFRFDNKALSTGVISPETKESGSSNFVMSPRMSFMLPARPDEKLAISSTFPASDPARSAAASDISQLIPPGKLGKACPFSPAVCHHVDVVVF